jgi:hypothetical protein
MRVAVGSYYHSIANLGRRPIRRSDDDRGAGAQAADRPLASRHDGRGAGGRRLGLFVAKRARLVAGRA